MCPLRLAQQTFLWLDQLRDYAKDKNFVGTEKAYAELLLCYDRFLKAGDLYPTYDPITSTEIFFDKISRSQLRYNTVESPKLWDQVLLIDGPDMGKTGVVLDIDGDWTITKLDKNGNDYQEVILRTMNSFQCSQFTYLQMSPNFQVKNVKLQSIAKVLKEEIGMNNISSSLITT